MTQVVNPPPCRAVPAATQWRSILPWLLIALLSLWLRTGFPISAIGWASHDDMLFIRLARNLGFGSWLGHYDNLTLAKGMFYPLFILVAFLLAIPLSLAEQAAYLAAAALATRFVWRITGSRRLGLILFGVLAFNPMLWNFTMTRAVREALYISLCLAAVILLLEVVFPRHATPGRRLLRGAAAGACFGAYWLTREEGAWLAPTVATALAVSLASALLTGDDRIRQRVSLWTRNSGMPLAAATLTFGLCIVGVATTNAIKYGVFVTNEFKATPFLRAYGALARIKPDRWRRFVVVSADAEQGAATVSPAMRELEPYLRGPGGDNWRHNGCPQFKDGDCSEIASNMFMWALRDAVAQAGHYRSASDTMRFYTRLADEIDAACADGRLACDPPRATMMPVFRPQYLGDAAADAVPIAGTLLSVGGREIWPQFSVGSPIELATAADMVGTIDPPQREEWDAGGWAASPAGKPTISLRDITDAAVEQDLYETPGADVAAAYPGWTAVRFQLRAVCPLDQCEIAFAAPGQPARAIPLRQLHAGAIVADGDLKVHLDFAAVRDPGMAHTRRMALQIGIARAIGWTYATLAPALSVVAIAGFAAAFIRRPRGLRLAPLAALAGACLTAVAARIALLAWLDVTSIPANNPLYASPAAPFVLVWVVCGCWLLAETVMRGIRSGEHPQAIRDDSAGRRSVSAAAPAKEPG